eukprot:8249031-Alexandrium_andersonii.AAC.1
MSASLVGSEMCIRDSLQLVLLSLLAAAVNELHAVLELLGAHGPDAIAQPVSYTHLTLPTICSV